MLTCSFSEKGMRGNVSYISKRQSNVNNQYLTPYNRKKITKYMTYLDKNNLSGCWLYSEFKCI